MRSELVLEECGPLKSSSLVFLQGNTRGRNDIMSVWNRQIISTLFPILLLMGPVFFQLLG